MLNKDIEVDKKYFHNLVEYDSEAIEQTKMAKIFEEVCTIQNKIDMAKRKGIYLFKDKMTDNELLAYHETIKYLYEKYIKDLDN